MIFDANKEFSRCASYSNGNGELLRKWIETNHPGVLILRVERASGSSQDLSVEGEGAVYTYRPLLDRVLVRAPSYSQG